MVERHIIQARARATAQEERILNGLKNETGELPPNLGLPPGKSEPSFFKETFSFHKRVSKSPVDDGYLESPEPEIPVRSHLDGSVSSLSLSSTSDNNEPSKRRPSQKGKSSKKVLWKQEMRAQDKEYEQFQLAQLEQPHNFLKNPRFLPPSSKHSGRSLIAPTKKREKAAPGSKNGPGDNESNEAVPVFLANPPVVFFPDYEVGQIYEMTVELRNVTASSRHVRIIPPSTPYFSIGLGKFPGEGGIVAPGMSCHYTVRFVPDSLSDFEDFILVESQAPYPVLVPIEARRPPPILTIPQTLACGPCLVGGVKLMECFCRNEGLSRGSFCIMPKSVWPPANFRSVATSGFVEQAPFGIRPAAFELYPGQAITIEVVFFPTSSETYNQVFTIVCDNCQVQDITLTGYGQLAALELVSVNDTESVPSNGKLTDIKPEHLVYFQPANLCSTLQKNLVIRNTTHVELPFYWQIMKPNLQGLLPGEPVDTTKIEYSPDASTPFIMSPVQGILLPHQDHSFTVKYTPTEMIEYHSVAQMVLRDVPKPPSAGKKPGSLAKLAPTVNDVIIMDLELKGATEPFQILLEPYAIIFPGESFIGTTMRKQFKVYGINETEPGIADGNGRFNWYARKSHISTAVGGVWSPGDLPAKVIFTSLDMTNRTDWTGYFLNQGAKMWNNSKSAIAYHWENITDCHIIQIEPRSGTIEPQKYYEFELFFTGEQCGFTSQTVTCHIEHSLEPVVLHVEAMFKGPEVSIDVPSLDLGLIKLGDRALSELTIENKSPLAAKWSILESRACLAERQEEESQFSIHPDSGELLPLAKAVLSVLFKPMTCQRLKTVLELQVENAKGSHLAVTADVQVPQVCLLSSTLEFTDVYVGVPAQSTVKMFNQGRLPTRFTWGELTGSQSVHCSATVTPASGILGPNEEAEMCVNLTANILDDVNDIALCCRVEDMKDPLVLSMKAKAKGLHATYSLSEEEETLDQSPPSTPEELLLDFGSDVSLQNTVQRKLVLTNHSGICAPFSLEAAYFTGCPVPQVLENSPSTVSLIQRTSRIATQAAKKAQADSAISALLKSLHVLPGPGYPATSFTDFRRSVLADGKGAAFLFQPKSGTLGAFQQISIQVTAYTNMWGEYSDELLCKVGDLKVKVIPMKMTVVGCPVYFQMTGPRPDKQTDGPVIRFGTHLSGGDTISRGLRINNPSPYDIRIDWETYNREERSSKLLDLVMLYGDPFPLKDIDGNEIVGSRLDYPESVGSPVNWDTIPSTSGTISSSSSRAISHLKDVEQAEDIEQDDNEDSQDVTVLSDENKLISVILRPHEGVASDYPYCITPRQTIVPAGGSSTVHVSFTPLMLSGVINKTECSGFALGFMSLDDKFAQTIPGKVKRLHGYGVEPIRMEFQAFVKPALLTVEVEDEDEGLVFYSVASDLIPDKKTCQILTKSVTTQSLKLLNCTETPLYFRLLLSSPFSVSSIDPTKSIKTSHSDRDEQGEQLVLHPQQNTLVKVSFCTSLELLTYQNLPANQMLPGVKLLQSENGEKKLHFTQELLIEYSNKSAQRFPLNAYLSVPVLQLSHHTVDFGTCFVGQTRTQEVYLLNKSGSKSYWTALMDKKERDSDHEIFSMSPTSGMLEAHITHASDSKEALLITFTARDSRGYQTTVMIHGLLGEKPLTLHIKGHGSYDEKYEAFVSV